VFEHFNAGPFANIVAPEDGRTPVPLPLMAAVSGYASMLAEFLIDWGACVFMLETILNLLPQRIQT